MAKSLILSLFIWIGSGAGYYFALHGRYEPPADWIASIVGSFTVLFGVGCLRNMRLAFIDRNLISSSTRGSIPSTKKMIAISGPICTIDQPVKTPFTDQDAVLFSYDVCEEYYETVRSSDNSTSKEKRSNMIVSGNVLTPCQVNSSWGNVKLLSYPSLEGFKKKYIDREIALEKAREFIAKTQFEDMTGVAVLKAISQAKDLFTDSDGTINKHLQMAKRYDLDSAEFKEEVVLNGEEVCLVGCYDPIKQGVVPDFKVGGGICRLYKGGQWQALKKINSKITGLIVGAVFFLFIVNAIMYFVLSQYDKADTQQMDRTSRLIDAINSEDMDKVREISKFAINPNFANSSRETPLMFARNKETTEILIAKNAILDAQNQYGRTPLMIASMYGREEVVDALLKAGANPNIKDNYNDDALSIARDNNFPSIAELLIKSGAEDDRIDEKNGEVIGIESEPVKTCFTYIYAIHNEDRETLKLIFQTNEPEYFDTVDFPLWKSTRPAKPILVEAFQKDDKAIVKITGETGRFNLQYKLQQIDGEWKIVKERVFD